MPTPDPTITDWLGAVAALVTLLVAVVVGVFSQRAAHWTKQQAQASREQVGIAADALVVARTEAQGAQVLAERLNLETERSTRRYAEAQVDALMPTVLALAVPGDPFLEVLRNDAGRPVSPWCPLVRPLELRDDESAVFRMNLTLTFTNVSTQIAVIDVVDAAHGETDGSGREMLLRPGQSKTIPWWRIVSSNELRTAEEIGRPQVWLMNLRFWVRDLGFSAYDIQLFNAGLSFFVRDGSRLIVTSGRPLLWAEQAAMPLPGRVYDRLDGAVLS